MSMATKIHGFTTNHPGIRSIASTCSVTPLCVLATIFLVAAGQSFVASESGTGRAIRNPSHWLLTAARRLLRRELRPTGFISLDEEMDGGKTLVELVEVPEIEQSIWQRADATGLAHICDVLENGTAAYATRHNVTRRRAQQVFAKATAEALVGKQGDLFAREAV